MTGAYLANDGSDRVDEVHDDAVDTLVRIASRASEQSSGENFPVALRALPAGPRDHLERLYSYARFVDDVGDEAPGATSDRLQLLDLIEADVRLLDPSTAGSPVLAPVLGMRPVLAERDAPVGPLLDLIEANRIDQTTTTYETFDDLLGYCALSAAPVGRMVLHIAGAATADNVAESDAVCNALQVLEHCQDVGEDARAGRVYLPQTELRAVGVSRDDLLMATTSPALRLVVHQQVERARGLLRRGRPLVRRLHGWARLAVSGYVAGGQATVSALARSDFDVLGRQIRPSRVETVARAMVAVMAR